MVVEEYNEEPGEGTYQRLNNRIYSRAQRGFEKGFKESFGEEIDVSEVSENFRKIEAMEEIASSEIKEPSFPLFTFFIALCIDVLGFADFTGVGWFVMSIVEIIFTIVLFYLMFGKLNSVFTLGSRAGFRRKKKLGKKRTGTSFAQKGLQNFAIKFLKKYISRRLLFILVIKLIPFIGILGSSAFFVVLAHNKQKKIVQKYMSFVESVSKALDGYYRNS